MGPIALVALAGGVAMLFILLWTCLSLIKKCGANQAMIISGYTGAGRTLRFLSINSGSITRIKETNDSSFKIVIGGRAVVFPVLQRINFLSLEVMPITVESSIIMKEAIPVSVSAVAQIKVRADAVSIATAAGPFIGKPDEEMAKEIAKKARSVIEAAMRTVLAKMTVAELTSNFDKMAIEFQQYVSPELAEVGLTCDAFSIRDVKENVGKLESLDAPKLSAN